MFHHIKVQDYDGSSSVHKNSSIKYSTDQSGKLKSHQACDSRNSASDMENKQKTKNKSLQELFFILDP